MDIGRQSKTSMPDTEHWTQTGQTNDRQIQTDRPVTLRHTAIDTAIDTDRLTYKLYTTLPAVTGINGE